MDEDRVGEPQGLCGLRQFYVVLVRVAVLVVLILLLVVAKVAWDAENHFREAEQALAEGDREEALWHFQWALRNYVPGLPTNRRAVTQIEGLAAEWAAAGETERATNALRTLRATLYSIHSFYQPFPDVLSRTEKTLGLSEDSSNTGSSASAINRGREEGR